MLKKYCLIIIFTLFTGMAAIAQRADAVLGKWINPTGEGEVQIYKKGNKYFGRLIWIKVPDDTDGKPKTDKHNPDKNLQTRPELGIELLRDFTFDGDNIYEDGTIYDPKTGKTYSCKMTLRGDVLKIRGYVGISLLGRTENWSRVK